MPPHHMALKVGVLITYWKILMQPWDFVVGPV
jgi:hypothetical protein